MMDYHTGTRELTQQELRAHVKEMLGWEPPVDEYIPQFVRRLQRQEKPSPEEEQWALSELRRLGVKLPR